MKILFLHLSDAHLKENTDFREININAMVNSLSQLDGFDECILIFSGDIADAGRANEYKTARCFLGKLLGEISKRYLDSKKFIRTMIVPGNHDNLVTPENKERNNLELEEYYKSKIVKAKFEEDLEQLDNFYEFANGNFCYRRNKVIDVRKVSINNYIFKINLINTAPFSLLGSGNRDKGLHYIPDSEFTKFDIDVQERYTISIMHHGPEWFNDASKQKLYKRIIETSDLWFVGHEHFSQSEVNIVNGKHIDISSGVALHGTDSEHGFNALILDTDKKSLKGYKYIYNGRIYKPQKTIDNNNVLFHSKHKFTFTQEFQRQILIDSNEREGEAYLDYFVFPSLEAKNISTEMKNFTATSEEKFMEIFESKAKISIEGSARAGKSLLAKYLCNYLSENYVPVLMKKENFVDKDPKNNLLYVLREEYGTDIDMDAFSQLDSSKKVLIVDGYDRVVKDKWSHFYAYAEKEFGHIIMFCGIDWNPNIKEKAIEELTEQPIYYMRICPFYYIKREQLIKKICTGYLDEHPNLNVAEKTKNINEDITNQIRYFQLTPDFIHQFVDYYISFSQIKTQKETNVFSKVFEANITFRISKNTRSENDVDEIMVALDFVANYIHFNKKYPLSYNEFEIAVNNYKKRYDNQELKPKYVYDVAVKSNILREVSDSFEMEFCDENLLAYFVAQHLNRACTKREGLDDLQYVLNNICFGINGDVILFLSYITSNTQILEPILQSISSHMKDWEELSLDTENIKYLSEVTTQVITKLPDQKDKEKDKEQKDEMEKQLIEDRKPSSESLYSYDEKKANSFTNKIASSINYLELVAKILPNFRHILEGNEKREITRILYTYPNKLLYFMLKDIDTNRDRIIADILKKEPRTRKGLLITKDIIKKELQNQSIGYILSIYDFISSTASNDKTIGDLERFDFSKNTNYRLQNLLMQENVGHFNQFFERAEALYDEKKILPITKQMVHLIVRKYFLHHEVELHGDSMRIIDKFFGKDQRKHIQMIQAKNQIIKK